MSESLVGTLGFCQQHTSDLSIVLAGNTVFRTRAITAVDWFEQIFASLPQTTDKVRTMVFGARHKCPACWYRKQREGQSLARFFRSLPQDRKASDRLLATQLCLDHLRAAVTCVSVETVAQALRIARLRIRKLDDRYGTWSLDGQQLARVPRLFSLERASLLEELVRADLRDASAGSRVPAGHYPLDAISSTTIGCVICDAVVSAQKLWRERFVHAVEQQQPLWLVSPTCTKHVAEVLMSPDEDCQYAAWSSHKSMLAKGIKPRPHKTPQSARRFRRSASWNLAVIDEVSDSERALEVLDAEDFELDAPPLRDAACPACDAEAIAQMKALLRTSRLLHQGVSPGEVCLKHFAEIFILEPDHVVRTNLVASQVCRLRRLVDRDPVGAFGTFS
ncbi:hypothetical protein [Pandoraea eparura]|uniref:hypothetical protein n=1 Tax=Pandoraea eparura TaxID=2508291 RepID=UPI00124143E8|nr:hypothetical protein [Pandoraea eparura]